ncbi:glucosaminidase domain-containing protein [Algibacter pacificus]|uniref:glucosaminidase domain-containing protein n=1 Tax=Algibacter pacificus TaxID=2599389 RepID=UPI0011C80655|nr:glucosaminidase domain-containing protein [Algibacter pacificus]
MKRILLILCVGAMLFSCKSKKAVANKKARKVRTEKVVTKKKEAEEVSVPVVKPRKRSSTETYIITYADVAIAEMQRYNIPASITLAQGILESGSGNGRLATEANNHFGIKCHEWDGDRIYHDDDAAQECFRKYDDVRNSFRDHSLFLTERSRYSKLFKLKKTDYKGWAKGLKAAGYATDPKYPSKLISLIERYDLHDYDKSSGKSRARVTRDITQKVIHVVVPGDTLYSISKKNNITVDRLKKLNNLEDNTIKIGQKLQVSLN